jgi:hypothetical protein
VISITLAFERRAADTGVILGKLVQRSRCNATWAICETWFGRPFWLLPIYRELAENDAITGAIFTTFYI